jgi:hypothetical protein
MDERRACLLVDWLVVQMAVQREIQKVAWMADWMGMRLERYWVGK